MFLKAGRVQKERIHCAIIGSVQSQISFHHSDCFIAIQTWWDGEDDPHVNHPCQVLSVSLDGLSEHPESRSHSASSVREDLHVHKVASFSRTRWTWFSFWRNLCVGKPKKSVCSILFVNCLLKYFSWSVCSLYWYWGRENAMSRLAVAGDWRWSPGGIFCQTVDDRSTYLMTHLPVWRGSGKHKRRVPVGCDRWHWHLRRLLHVKTFGSAYQWLCVSAIPFVLFALALTLNQWIFPLNCGDRATENFSQVFATFHFGVLCSEFQKEIGWLAACIILELPNCETKDKECEKWLWKQLTVSIHHWQGLLFCGEDTCSTQSGSARLESHWRAACMTMRFMCFLVRAPFAFPVLSDWYPKRNKLTENMPTFHHLLSESRKRILEKLLFNSNDFSWREQVVHQGKRNFFFARFLAAFHTCPYQLGFAGFAFHFVRIAFAFLKPKVLSGSEDVIAACFLEW